MGTLTSTDFTVYSVGLTYASVCTSLSDDEATSRLNIDQPTGVGPWAIAANPTFSNGDPNPRSCDQKPDTHRHILFSC